VAYYLPRNLDALQVKNKKVYIYIYIYIFFLNIDLTQI